MKNWLCFVVVILLAACQPKINENDVVVPIANEAKNNITIDTAKQVIDTIELTKTDTAFILKNKLIKDDIGDKQENYTINVYFSDKKFPVLTHKDAIGADLYLTDDLDGDGKRELLLRPDWFSSCWASINLYSIKNNKWILIKKGSMYFCADEYPLSKRVIKTEKGYGLLTDSLSDDKFITLKKEIKF